MVVVEFLDVARNICVAVDVLEQCHVAPQSLRRHCPKQFCWQCQPPYILVGIMGCHVVIVRSHVGGIGHLGHVDRTGQESQCCHGHLGNHRNCCIWMLRSAAILKVKNVDVVRQCWSKRTAAIKTEECCGHRWSAKC